MELHNLIRYTFLACSIGTLAACSSANDGTSTPTSTTVSGSIFAAPVGGAVVTIEDTNGNTIADSVNTADTTDDTNGTFEVTLDNTDLASTLVFESTGGTFKDEATGDASVAAGTMSVMTEANSLSSSSNNVHATPGTTIISKLVSGGMAMNDAIDAFTTAFGYTPDHSIAPTDTTNPATVAEDAQILAGLRAAAFSQLAMELGLTSDQQFDLFDALTEDLLSDGLLDGVGATSLMLSEDIQNRFATALLNYHNNGLMMPTADEFNPNNKTVLSNDKIGILPFGKVALTNDYRVEYMGMASVGKTVFTLKVTLHDGVTPVDNLSPALMPVMNMADMRHNTPVGSVINNNDGTYDFTIYYLMPNMMGGYWDLGVELDGTNTAHFYPTVMNPMDGTTSRVVLKGLNDNDDMTIDDDIPTMDGGEAARPYFMFKENLISQGASGGQHDFSFTLFARETMMSHPAIDDNPPDSFVLNSGTPYQLSISSVVIEVSGDDGQNWVTAVNDGTNLYTATGITGLKNNIDPITGLHPIRIKLSVNGVAKTKLGDAPVVDVNDTQTFFVTLP